MSDSHNIKQMLGIRNRDIILSDNMRPLKDVVQCWIHDDRTPSMSYQHDTHNFHCFGCGATVDIFDHYQQHYGLSFGESIQELSKLAGYTPQDSYQPSLMKRKVRIEVEQKYTDTIKKKIDPINFDYTDFLKNQIKYDINPSDMEIYNLGGNNEEIFFRHYEVKDNQWVDCFSKRRKIDGGMYLIDEKESKEISVAGGQPVFFGMPTLYQPDGKFKRFAIICEGHKDCLATWQSCVNEGLGDTYGVLSLPNGSKSLKRAVENSPTFRRWMKKASAIIIIPDNDKAGLELIEGTDKKEGDAALYLPAEKTKWCDISKLSKKLKDGADMEDALALGIDLGEILSIQEPIPVKQCVNLRKINTKDIVGGISSGFLTHDYNDSGLKGGGVTLVTGTRGSGKTTFVKQIVSASARQGVNSFCFFGEGSPEEEKSHLIKICSTAGKPIPYDNGFGRTIYKPSPEMIQDFNDNTADRITFYMKPEDTSVDLFDDMMEKMIHYAIGGHKLFILDNLMVITGGMSGNEFRNQDKIIGALKEFALNYDVHVILLAHPKKGEGFQSISGSAKIENTADSMLRYVRVDKNQAQAIAEAYNLPQCEINNVSAVIMNEKVRNEGKSFPIFLEWIEERGITMDIAYLEDIIDRSESYRDIGYFSRPIVDPSEVVDMGGVGVNGRHF